MQLNNHRAIARALLLSALQSGTNLRPNEGQFLGQISFDANPPSEKQANWLTILVERYGDAGKARAA